MRLASKHVSHFAKWKAKGPYRTWIPELAAVVYAKEFGLPNRFPFHQTLAQMYEQEVLNEINPYPPHLNVQRKVFSFRRLFRKQAAQPA